MADVYRGSGSVTGSDGGNAPGQVELGPDVTPDDLYLSDENGPELDLTGFQRHVIDWIRENQMLAMIGGFAVGVFLGALLRD